MTIQRFVIPVSLFLVFGASAAAWAQGVQPYPNAFTDREVHLKTPMAPPPINTVFQDPDFGALMVRATDDNTNPKVLHSYFRNPESEKNAWSADSRKFFLVSQQNKPLAFGFDPSTMLISALPGAGAGGGFTIPLHAGPTFSFVDPDLMYGTMAHASLTMASFRFSTGAVTPLIDTTTCGTQPPLVAGPNVTSSGISILAHQKRPQNKTGGTQPGQPTFGVRFLKQIRCRLFKTPNRKNRGGVGA